MLYGFRFIRHDPDPLSLKITLITTVPQDCSADVRIHPFVPPQESLFVVFHPQRNPTFIQLYTVPRRFHPSSVLVLGMCRKISSQIIFETVVSVVATCLNFATKCSYIVNHSLHFILVT